MITKKRGHLKDHFERIWLWMFVMFFMLVVEHMMVRSLWDVQHEQIQRLIYEMDRINTRDATLRHFVGWYDSERCPNR
jgi:hypothetical protein